MTKEQIRDTVLTFIRTSIVYDETRVIRDDESFLSSGILDSTGVLELIGFLEDTYGLTFRDDELVASNFDTLENLSAFIAARVNATVE
jgi:acyl carrier protein